MSTRSRAGPGATRDGRRSAASSSTKTSSPVKKAAARPSPTARTATRSSTTKAKAKPSPSPGPSKALVRECKLAWMMAGPNRHDRVDRKRLLKALHFLGKDPTLRQMHDHCSQHGAAEAFSFSDLLALAGDCQRITSDELLEAFQLIDEDGNGSLSRKELREALTKYGEHMTEREVEEVLALFDTDGDGSIDYNEFVEMMLTFVEQSRHLRPGKGHTDVYAPLAGAAGSTEEEPRELKEWDCDRLLGCFQVLEHDIVMAERYSFQIRSPTEVYLSLRPKRGRLTPLVDVMFFLISVDEEDGSLALKTTSNHSLHGNAHVRLMLDPGSYIIVPFCSGCKLRKRTHQPIKTPALRNADGELTSEARDVIKHIFARFDFNGRGTLSRHEYDMLLMLTDGQPCDDETWQFIEDTLEMKHGELGLKGFMQMYEQMSRVEEEDDVFYENFESVGYNRALELDEACPFTLFTFTKTRGALEQLDARPFDASVLLRCVNLTLDTGEAVVCEGDELVFLQYRQSSLVILGMQNEGRGSAKVQLDCSGSQNVCTHRPALQHSMVVPSESLMAFHYLVPDDVDRSWKVKVQIN